MSKQFSLRSWASRLHSSKSCIISHRHAYDKPEGYYALAEDRKGEHCPYPLLPKWAQRLFRWRLALRFTLYAYVGPSSKRLTLIDITPPVRGQDWHFHCPSCGTNSFFTLRGTRCWHCGDRFDSDLRVVEHAAVFSGTAIRYGQVDAQNDRWTLPDPANVFDEEEFEDIPF